MDWQCENENNMRFQILSGIFGFKNTNFQCSVLDFACGTSAFYEFLKLEPKFKNFSYTGLDINNELIECARQKYPQNKYFSGDILHDKSIIKEKFDYVIINGLFTQKLDLSDSEMFSFWKDIISSLWNHCNKGIAFNSMSQFVDYKRDGNYHLEIGSAGEFLKDNISNNFLIRNDYNLYETTFYIFRDNR
jgi:SAM-dependent methyltransferase